MHALAMKSKEIDWENVGFETMLECDDEARAVEICGLRLQAYEDLLRPGTSHLESQIEHKKSNGLALHSHLYDRPIPVEDAAMLTHRFRIWVVLTLGVLAAATSATSNFAMFWLLGWGTLWAAVAAVAITALPLGLGHLAYERVLAGHKGLQVAIIAAIAILGCNAVYQFGQARRTVMDKAAAQSAVSSYVDSVAPDTPSQPEPPRSDEAKVRGSLGGALFMASLAAELAVGFLVGLFVQMRTDADYTAWQQLKQILQRIVDLEEQMRERYALIEIAKKHCMAGIRRAQTVGARRHAPYYKALVVLILLLVLGVPRSYAQTIEHYDGILIDTSGSIGRASPKGEIFRKYLASTKHLLLTEPAESRVWVLTISTDSFGGSHEIVEGWTAQAHGIFTDDLTRARQQLASTFESRSSGMAPTAAGTDIFGGLWRLKVLFESSPSLGQTRTIHIFSDMVNETTDFNMRALIADRPEQMLERAKVNGLLVPLDGYQIYIHGVSPSGLSAREWNKVKAFWERYFEAVGAKLLVYSPECGGRR